MKNKNVLIIALATLSLASCQFKAGTLSSPSSEESLSSSSNSETTESSEEPKVPLLAISVRQKGPTQFFKGETFSAEGLVVVGQYLDGTEKVLDNNRLVFSGIDLNEVGIQTLTIGVEGHYTSYQIAVLAVDDISIQVGGFDKKTTQRGDCASAFQSPFGLVYKDHALDPSSIRVNVTYSQDGATVEGLLPLDDPRVRLNNFSSSTIGQQEAKITVDLGERIAASLFPYSVTNAIPYINRGQTGRFIECRVDASYEGMEGAVVQGTQEDPSRGYSHLFKSVSSALDFIELNNIESTIVKNIVVASGDYNEKIDVSVPYLSITGDGGEVKIHSFETIGTRPGLEKEEETYVLAVRESALYFQMKGITVVNDAINVAAESESLPAAALLCQADGVNFDECSFSGVDKAVILNHGRRRFLDCSFVGRNAIVRGNSTADLFSRCTFTPLCNPSETTFNLVSLDGAGKGGLEEALELCACFQDCTFAEVENVGKYAMMVTDSPYTRINFNDCTFPSYLGESRDTFFPSGAYSNTTKSIRFGFAGESVPSFGDEAIPLFVFDNVNGKVRFPYEWDGTRPNHYNAIPEIYLNFDGFSYRNDAQQTVIAHDLDLPASDQATQINSVLTLCPVNGIRFDPSKNMTFFGKGSYFSIQVPVGARVDVYTEELEGSRYSTKGFAKINGDGVQDTLYIYKSVSHFYANGKIGEMQTQTFKAMGDSYLKFVVITPNVLTSDALEDPSVSYAADPTSMFVRNYNDRSFPSDTYFTPATIYGPLRNNIWLEYDTEGFHALPPGGRNLHLHTTLSRYYPDSGGYDGIEFYNSDEDWYAFGLTGGHGGTIHGDVVENYYGQTGNGVPFGNGDNAFNSVKLVYLFTESDEKNVETSPAADRLAWARIVWIDYAAPRDYRTTKAGSYDFSAANLWDDASDHEFLLEDSVSSIGYSVSTGDSHVCAYDSVNGGLRLDGQIEYRIKAGSSLGGGKLVIRAKKGSVLSARIGDSTTALETAPYATPDYDFFECAVPDGDDKTINLIPGEGGATLFSYELRDASGNY